MSDNLKKQFHKLELVTAMKTPAARKILLTEFSKDNCFCKAVREIVKNTLKRNIKLPEKDKRKLSRHKKLILSLAKKRKNRKRTQKLIQQTGTGIFLPIVLPLVASVISDLFRK